MAAHNSVVGNSPVGAAHIPAVDYSRAVGAAYILAADYSPVAAAYNSAVAVVDNNSLEVVKLYPVPLTYRSRGKMVHYLESSARKLHRSS